MLFPTRTVLILPVIGNKITLFSCSGEPAPAGKSVVVEYCLPPFLSLVCGFKEDPERFVRLPGAVQSGRYREYGDAPHDPVQLKSDVVGRHNTVPCMHRNSPGQVHPQRLF